MPPSKKPAKQKPAPKTAAKMAPANAARPKTFAAMCARHRGEPAKIAKRLRSIVTDVLGARGIDEGIYGGAAVALALYSRGGTANVLCGISPAADHCKLFVHYLRRLDHPTWVLQGTGKHALHIKLARAADVVTTDVAAILREVERLSGL
jgi:hypothetical protein